MGIPGSEGGIGSFLAGLSIVPDGQWMSEAVLLPSNQTRGLVAGPSMRAAVRWRLLGWKRQTAARLADEVFELWGQQRLDLFPFPKQKVTECSKRCQIPRRDSITIIPVCSFPASRCRRALFWVWHCLKLSLIQEKQVSRMLNCLG